MLRVNCFIIVLVNIRTQIRADYFTAVDDMSGLIQTHQEVTNWLNKYIEIESKRLDVLQRLLEDFKLEERRVTDEGIRYLESPINVYKLIKRLTKDLELIEKKVKTKYRHRLKKPLQYPTSEDLLGAAKAVARLELIYKLNTTDLANGVITGTFSQYNKPYVEKVTPMRSSDCYELARALYSENHYGNGKPWMEEALKKYRVEKEWHYYTDDKIIESIKHAEIKVAEQRSIDEETKKLPLKKVENNCTTMSGDYNLTDPFCIEERNREKNFVPVLLNSAKRYSALCRGECDISGSVAKKLFCRYFRSHPYFVLAPVKMEQLYIRPDIFLFYDVISESEMKHLKEMAKKKGLKRTMVHDGIGKLTISNDRISKYAWLPDSTSDVIRRLTRRVGDVTGLDENRADLLSVVNYGIGGYYAPHYDYFRLSNVPQGGATIFTEPGLTVFPVRGAALFWHNLHPSGDGDLATYHAACPVLSGSKWVATKWLFNLGQELRNPCTQPENPLYKTPKPKLKIFQK